METKEQAKWVPSGRFICDAAGNKVAEAYGDTPADAEQNKRRIVAAVNRFAGIETDGIERMPADVARLALEYIKAMTEVAELENLLKWVARAALNDDEWSQVRAGILAGKALTDAKKTSVDKQGGLQ